MKKLLKTLAFSAIAALVCVSAFAEAGWLGAGAIYIGEKVEEGVCNGWYYADQHESTTWCSGPFGGANLGELTSLTLGGQVQLWDENSADWGWSSTAKMYYSIDGGTAQLMTLDYYKFANNNNFFQSGRDPMVPTEVSLAGLAPGAHTLAIYFDDYDSLKTTATYTATFTIADAPSYTLVESADDLVVGADYLVVSTVDGVASALKNETSGDGIGVGVVAIDGTTAYTSDDALVWKIMEGAETGLPAQGLRVLFNAASVKYAAAPDTAGDGAQLLADRKDALAQWTLDLSALPAVKFVSVSYADRSLQRDADADNAWFAAYDSAQAVPRLYKSDSTELQTVTFDANGGTYPAETMSMTYVVGSEYWGILKPSFADHEFLGWFDAQGKRVMNFSEVTAESTRELTARWGRAGQAVTLVANGGQCATDALTCSGTYKGIPKPTLAGFEFLGWFDEAGTRFMNGMPVTDAASLTLTARWGRVGQTVTLEPKGGECATTTLTCSGTYKGIPKPTLAGFEFLGWFDEAGTRFMNGMPVTDAASLTLTARWGRVGQTVTLEPKGGECATTTLTCSGTYKGLSLPTLAGSTFLGWFDAETDGIRVKNGMPVTEDASRTLYAYWREGTAAAAISGFSMSFRSARGKRSTTTVTDTLTAALFSATSTTYKDFSDVSVVDGSDAVYAGNSAKTSSGGIQLRTKNSEAGIVTTTSGGTATKVSVVWEGTGSQVLDIYGKTSTYTDATELYDVSTQGTFLGSLTNGATSTALEIGEQNCTSIGLRSHNNALYLTSVSIDWLVEGDDPQPTTDPTVTLSASAEEVYAGEAVTITASAANFSVGEDDLVWEWSVNGIVDDIQDGTTFTLDTSVADTYEVKAEATDGDAITNATVSILVKPQTVTLTPTATEVEVGETVTITATAEGFSGAVTWEWAGNGTASADGTTFTVNTSAAGSYEIVAEATSGTQSALNSVTITVSEHVEVTGDVLTRADTGATGSSYVSWTATGASGTKYAGNSAGSNESIQLRKDQGSGIVITESTGRDVKSVTVDWNSNTVAARTNLIYGRTTAYSSPADLHGNDKGTLLGTIGRDATTFAVPEGYRYIGILAQGGAIYLTSVTIEFAAATPTVTLEASATEVEVGDPAVTITATAENFSGPVTWSWTVNGTPVDGYTAATYTVGTSVADEYEITATATDGTNTKTSAPVTVKVNAPATKYPITIDQAILQYATVATDPAGEAAENAEVTVTVNPNAGYVLDVIKVNGTEITGNTFNMPAAAVTVSATFVAVPTYTLVESAADLVVGADYLIVASGEGYTNAMKGELTSGNTKRLSVEDVTVSADGKTIATDSDAIVWQLQEGAETGLPPQGLRVLYSAAANKYAAAPSSSTAAARLLDDGTDEAAQWTIDTSDMMAVMIQSAKYNTRYLQRNHDAGNRYFAAYTGEQAPRFYRADSTVLQTVTFDANGGTYPAEKTTMKYVVGREYWGIWKPSLEGHEFLGWFDAQGKRVSNFQEVTTESTRALTARWGRAGQAVTLNPNGGQCATDTLTCSGTYAGIPKPTLAGFEFLGWFDEAGTRFMNGMPVTDAASLTLTARWGKAGQTVTLNANGGQCATTTLTCSGTYKGIPKPTLAGSEFLGWFDDQGTRFMNGMPVTDAASLTLTARWGVASQTVTLDAKGGQCATTTLTCSGTYKGLSLPTLAGNTFLGWFDAETDGARVKNGMPVTGGAEKTLYAYWRESAAPASISGFTMSTRSATGARNARSGDEQVSTLRFETVADFVYEVQWTPALGGEWTVLKRWTAKADGIEEVTVSFPASYSTGFFRFEIFDEVE